MALKSVSAVTYSTSATADYSEYEDTLKEILAASFDGPKNRYFSAELDTKAEAVSFMHAAKKFAEDNGVVYSQKRDPRETFKTFRFNQPKTDSE